jgi:hypothetical protein
MAAAKKTGATTMTSVLLALVLPCDLYELGRGRTYRSIVQRRMQRGMGRLLR